MRVAFIAGFFNPVKTSLEKQFPKELKDRSIIWIPQNSPGGELSINKLEADLLDSVGKGATHILIVAFILRSRSTLYR